MRGYFSIKPKAHGSAKGRRGSNASKSTPDNRQWSVDLGGGFTREDSGAPPARLPSETQPTPQADLVVPVSAPAEIPPVVQEVTEAAPVASPSSSNAPKSTNWQREFGLGR